MADQKTSKAPEDIEKELSVGNFAKVQGRTMLFQLGGMAAGLAAGIALAKTGMKSTVGKWWAKYFAAKVPGASAELIAKNTEQSEEIARRFIIPGFGVFLGSTIGGIASMYEHWVKAERERLSVQEINKDVAGLMEKRVEFEDTLDKQHSIIKTMLEKHETHAGYSKHEAHAGQSKGEKRLAEKEAAASAEHARS